MELSRVFARGYMASFPSPLSFPPKMSPPFLPPILQQRGETGIGFRTGAALVPVPTADQYTAKGSQARGRAELRAVTFIPAPHKVPDTLRWKGVRLPDLPYKARSPPGIFVLFPEASQVRQSKSCAGLCRVPSSRAPGPTSTSSPQWDNPKRIPAYCLSNSPGSSRSCSCAWRWGLIPGDLEGSARPPSVAPWVSLTTSSPGKGWWRRPLGGDCIDFHE